jgi:hypothetical protein
MDKVQTPSTRTSNFVRAVKNKIDLFGILNASSVLHKRKFVGIWIAVLSTGNWKDDFRHDSCSLLKQLGHYQIPESESLGSNHCTHYQPNNNSDQEQSARRNTYTCHVFCRTVDI